MWEQNGRESGFVADHLRENAAMILAADGEEDIGRLLAASDGLQPAAVLVPIVDRSEGASILLTRRTGQLPHHAGQIAFPGGKIDARDQSVEAAALRETFEETGIEPERVELIGRLDSHATGTGFRIYPVVGIIAPGFVLNPCEREVDEIFEVPLDFLLDVDVYRLESIVWRGADRRFWVIDYGSYRIWGATAFILKKLQERIEGR